MQVRKEERNINNTAPRSSCTVTRLPFASLEGVSPKIPGSFRKMTLIKKHVLNAGDQKDSSRRVMTAA